MGRRNTRWTSNMYDICVIGEQLRKQMHEQGLIRDRRHHLRKFKQCFIGREVVDWLLKMFHAESRQDAVSAMQILKQNGLYHHATDEHEFKDQNVFYRFCFDDDTYKLNKDLASFYRGLDIYRKLKSNTSDLMQEFYLKGALYSNAFYGSDVVDFIVVLEGVQERDVVIQELRGLLERDIIKHVTDDYHFSDDKLIYEFNLDFDKPCLLQDILDITGQRKKHSISEFAEMVATGTKTEGNTCPEYSETIGTPSHDAAHSSVFGTNRSSGSCSDDVCSTSVTTTDIETNSVLVHPATVQQFENHNFPYIRTCLQIERDVIGFGFALQGSSPCHVQSVDPLGPAAAAGLKVHQFISSVNGQNVLSKDHRQVGQVMTQSNKLTITVFTHGSAL